MIKSKAVVPRTLRTPGRACDGGESASVERIGESDSTHAREEVHLRAALAGLLLKTISCVGEREAKVRTVASKSP